MFGSLIHLTPRLNFPNFGGVTQRLCTSCRSRRWINNSIVPDWRQANNTILEHWSVHLLLLCNRCRNYCGIIKVFISCGFVRCETVMKSVMWLCVLGSTACLFIFSYDSRVVLAVRVSSFPFAIFSLQCTWVEVGVWVDWDLSECEILVFGIRARLMNICNCFIQDLSFIFSPYPLSPMYSFNSNKDCSSQTLLVLHFQCYAIQHWKFQDDQSVLLSKQTIMWQKNRLPFIYFFVQCPPVILQVCSFFWHGQYHVSNMVNKTAFAKQYNHYSALFSDNIINPLHVGSGFSRDDSCIEIIVTKTTADTQRVKFSPKVHSSRTEV